MTQDVKGVLRYPGGKTKLLKKILPLIPKNFDEYREPFVGGGSVFIASKQQINSHAFYWINDLNYELYCFWKQLRDNSNFLIKKILDIKNEYKDGQSLYYLLKKNEFKSKKELDDAVRFFVLNRITFSGLSDSGGYSQESFEKRFTLSSIERLTSLSGLIQDVEVTNTDYENLLFKEGDNVFIFLDPPYFNARKAKLYGKMGNLHTSFDHIKFANNMRKCKYNWLITYDDSPEIRKMFSFANIYEWEAQYGVNHGYIKKMNGGKAKKGNELFISNYPLEVK